MITVVDYGMGNLRNVRRAFEQLGHPVRVTSDGDLIEKSAKVVLPGVGSFGAAVQNLESRNLRGVLERHIRSAKPLLGICLGMQLLYEGSEESPGAAGFAVFPGKVKRFGAGVKIPHIGWNDVVPRGQVPLFAGGAPVCCYFVHSFYVELSDDTTGTTEYGVPFASAVARGNLYGFQFHPEKSQDAGLALLDAFARQ